MKRNGACLWLTGLSGAGKSTIAYRLERELREQGCLVELLDGDAIRKNLSKDLGFSREDRNTNVRRVGYVANLLSRNGVIAIVSMISPYRAVRDELRQSTENLVEIYINAPLTVCEARDIKGLYAKARSGQIKAFTGVDDPYEEPLNPHITCYTSKETIDQSVTKIITWLTHFGSIELGRE